MNDSTAPDDPTLAQRDARVQRWVRRVRVGGWLLLAASLGALFAARSADADMVRLWRALGVATGLFGFVAVVNAMMATRLYAQIQRDRSNPPIPDDNAPTA